MVEPWSSWRDSLDFLRGSLAVPAALMNASTLVIAQHRWSQHLLCRTSMHDLLFTRPGDEYPFPASVRVRVVGAQTTVETDLNGQRATRVCTPDDLDRTVDAALEQLAAPLRICRGCGETVATDAFEVFERMHYVCFHYQFEHRGTDRDEPCGVPGCPVAAS